MLYMCHMPRKAIIEIIRFQITTCRCKDVNDMPQTWGWTIHSFMLPLASMYPLLNRGATSCSFIGKMLRRNFLRCPWTDQKPVLALIMVALSTEQFRRTNCYAQECLTMLIQRYPPFPDVCWGCNLRTWDTAQNLDLPKVVGVSQPDPSTNTRIHFKISPTATTSW